MVTRKHILRRIPRFITERLSHVNLGQEQRGLEPF